LNQEIGMSETRFTRDHEWLRLDDGVATIGITDHAQQALGDIVFVELPEPGRTVAAAEACAVVESVKAASDIYAPVAGRVSETNAALADDPALVNRDPAGAGWFFRLVPTDPAAVSALMDAAAYAAFLETL
jgi:glycine cleavage system H protein